MEAINIKYTVLRGMYDYPERFAGANKQLYISNNYISNGNVIIKQSFVKNHDDIIKSTDGVNYNFNSEAIQKIGKLPVNNSITRYEDTVIENALTPQGHAFQVRPMGIINTSLLIAIQDTGVENAIVTNMYLQVWIDTENKEYIFFNDALLKQFNYKGNTLHGWNATKLFVNSQNDDFMIGIMPVASNIFKSSDLSVTLKQTLEGLLQVVSCQ